MVWRWCVVFVSVALFARCSDVSTDAAPDLGPEGASPVSDVSTDAASSGDAGTVDDAPAVEDAPLGDSGPDTAEDLDVVEDVGEVGEGDAIDVAPDATMPDDAGPADVESDVTVDVVPDASEPLTVTDADGNVYRTVQIGEQVWMAENLKVTRFNDGTPLEAWSFGMDWFDPAGVRALYQWSETSDLNGLHDDELPEDFYGALYNEVALASGRLAPPGWRVPTRADFEALFAFVASDVGDENIVSALKTTTSWSPGSGNGTDRYGFGALPTGYVSAVGTATGAQFIAVFGTSAVDPVLAERTVVSFSESASGPRFEQNSTRLGAGVRLIRER